MKIGRRWSTIKIVNRGPIKKQKLSDNDNNFKERVSCKCKKIILEKRTRKLRKGPKISRKKEFKNVKNMFKY